MKTPAYGLGLDLDKLEASMREQAIREAEEMDPPAPDGRKRSSFLGGSEIGAVIGVSPWATPLDVYFSKTGERPPSGQWRDPQRERNFRRGKRAEPHAIQMAREDLGIKITKVSTPDAKNYYVDAEHPFLACEIDFEWEVTQDVADRYELPQDLVGTIQNGEVKSVHPFAAGRFGDSETEEVPIEYGAQAMHGLGVTGRKLTMFLVLTGWDELNVYWIWRDDAVVAAMRAAAVRFWKEHVEPRIPPEPANLPDVMNLFRRAGAYKVLATAEIKGLIADLIKGRAEAKAAADKVEDLQYRIGCAVLGKEEVENPDDPGKTRVVDEAGQDLLVIDFQQQYDLNEAKLKANFPQVAEACAKMQQFFVYRVPRKKKDVTIKKADKSKEKA